MHSLSSHQSAHVPLPSLGFTAWQTGNTCPWLTATACTLLSSHHSSRCEQAVAPPPAALHTPAPNRGAGPSLLGRLCGILLRTCNQSKITIYLPGRHSWQDPLPAWRLQQCMLTASEWAELAVSARDACRQLCSTRSHLSALQLWPLLPDCGLLCSQGSAMAVAAVISTWQIPREIQRRAPWNLQAACSPEPRAQV